MKKTFLIFTILASLLILPGQGCVRIKGANIGPADGGLWLSPDKGETWVQKGALLTTGREVKTIANLNAVSLVFDPQDSQTIYFLSVNQGLFVSYDGGESWWSVDKLPQATINSLAIDPKAKNVLYVAIGNRIFKTTDCCRTWQNIYLDIPGVNINTLAIDPLETKRIYAGLADGRLIKSEDGGLTWAVRHDFKVSLKQILINPSEAKIIYVASATDGIFRSTDLGVSWQKINLEELNKFPGSHIYHYGFFNRTKKDALYILTDYGPLFSDEGVKNWQDYKLLTQPRRVKIHSFAVNPKNTNEVYYATETSFYKSTNGGQTWITKKLPTKRWPIMMLVNPDNPNFIYFGALKVEK